MMLRCLLVVVERWRVVVVVVVACGRRKQRSKRLNFCFQFFILILFSEFCFLICEATITPFLPYLSSDGSLTSYVFRFKNS